MSNQRPPEYKTGLGYRGESDNINEKEEGFFSKQHDASQKRYDMATKYVKLRYGNTFS